MKKRVLMIVTVLLLVLSLSACGGSEKNEASHELEAYVGEPLTKTMEKIEELNYTATYIADGVDFTEFIDSVKKDYLTGELQINEEEKTVEVELVLASNVEADKQAAALEKTLQLESAWIAVSEYGKDKYNDSFDLNYVTGKINESLEDEETWFLKATCNVNGEEKTCEAKVTGTTNSPEVISFDVY